MSLLVDPKPLSYAFGERLPSADVNTVWHQQPHALDTRGGSTYTPTAQVFLDGAFGLKVKTFVVPLAGSADFCDGSVIITSAGGLAVGGGVPASFAGLSTFTGVVALANDVSISGAGNKFTFDTSADAPEFKNGLNSSAGINNFTGTVSCIGDVQIPGPGNAIVLSNSGSIAWRPAYSLTNVPTETFGVTTGGTGNLGVDSVRAISGVLAQDCTVTVTSTGARAGSRMKFHTTDNAFQLDVKNDNGVTIALIKTGGGGTPVAGFYTTLELEHTGSANGWFIAGGLRA